MRDDDEPGAKPMRMMEGEWFLCPRCTVASLVEKGELEAYDTPPEAMDRGIAMHAIRQAVQPGATARIVFICVECGNGIRYHVTVHREEPIVIPPEALEGYSCGS